MPDFFSPDCFFDVLFALFYIQNVVHGVYNRHQIMLLRRYRYVDQDNGNASPQEAQAYVEYLEEKYNRKLDELDIQIDGDYADLNYKFSHVPFERIRRITEIPRRNDGITGTTPRQPRKLIA